MKAKRWYAPVTFYLVWWEFDEDAYRFIQTFTEIQNEPDTGGWRTPHRQERI
jgi:hypothetical protein